MFDASLEPGGMKYLHFSFAKCIIILETVMIIMLCPNCISFVLELNLLEARHYNE